MRETSSAPATHTSTRATLSERTPPRGRSWRCSHPSMEITDMWVNLNFYNLNYFHFPISQSKVNVWPPHFSLKLSILVDLTYIFAQLDFYSAFSFKLPTWEMDVSQDQLFFTSSTMRSSLWMPSTLSSGAWPKQPTAAQPPPRPRL